MPLTNPHIRLRVQHENKRKYYVKTPYLIQKESPVLGSSLCLCVMVVKGLCSSRCQMGLRKIKIMF